VLTKLLAERLLPLDIAKENLDHLRAVSQGLVAEMAEGGSSALTTGPLS
jgi:hypothetical protein